MSVARSPVSQPSNLRSIALMVASMALFAVADALIKALSVDLPTGQILLWLGTGGALVLAAMAKAAGHALWSPALLHPAVIIRTGSELIGTALIVTGLALASFSLVSAILQVTPLFTTLGAAIFLRERVGPRRWTAIALGILGMLLIIQPWTAEVSLGAMTTLLGTTMQAARDVATRRVPEGVDSRVLSVYGFLGVIVAGGILLVITPGFAPMDPRHFALIAANIIVAVLAYLAITAAMRVGEVSAVAPFRYTRLVFALAIGVVVFGDRPDALVLFGAAIVIGSGLYVFWREARAKGG